jgi:hypothetical protein
MPMRPLLAASLVLIRKLNIVSQPVLGILIIIPRLLIPHQVPGQCILLLRLLAVPLVPVKLKLVLLAAGALVIMLIPIVR